MAEPGGASFVTVTALDGRCAASALVAVSGLSAVVAVPFPIWHCAWSGALVASRLATLGAVFEPVPSPALIRPWASVASSVRAATPARLWGASQGQVTVAICAFAAGAVVR